jgi:hypothetical protein
MNHGPGRPGFRRIHAQPRSPSCPSAGGMGCPSRLTRRHARPDARSANPANRWGGGFHNAVLYSRRAQTASGSGCEALPPRPGGHVRPYVAAQAACCGSRPLPAPHTPPFAPAYEGRLGHGPGGSSCSRSSARRRRRIPGRVRPSSQRRWPSLDSVCTIVGGGAGAA